MLNGALMYKIKNNCLYFLVAHKGPDFHTIPEIYAEEDEALICEIREKTGLEAKLDIIFRHDTFYEPVDGSGKTVVFIAAEAVTGDVDDWEEGDPLEWYLYDRAIKSVKSSTDKDILSHAAVYLGIQHSLQITRSWLALDHSGDGIWYREHAVDIHSHIIPEVDDGAQSVGEGIELLHLDWNEGIRRVFATPHYGIENGYAPAKNQTREGFGRLNEYVMLGFPGMKIFQGSEWYCSDDIVERIRNKEAFPMGNSDCYMVEFLEWGELTEPADVMLRRLKKMRDNRINTILAHPERYRAIQQDWDLAKRIVDIGVMLQVNAYDLALNPKDATRDLAQWMAKEELISFIGSDMHGTRIKEDGKPARRPQMKEGIRWLYDNVDYEYANEIVRVNAEHCLGVDRLL